MKSVNFIAAFGKQDKKVYLSYMKGDYFHIYIDHFYYGQIVLVNGSWEVCPQHSDSFTKDDMDALLERSGLWI